MATSISKAQTPLSCPLCNQQKGLKWKCTECELLMCDNCKTNVHSRIKTSEKHNVISIQDVGNDLSERLKALHISKVCSIVFNTYTTSYGGIHKLICCADDIIYFMNYSEVGDCHFLKAKLLKASMKILQKIEIECVDFAISNQREILFPSETTLIAASTATMETKTVLNTSPMLILAIHISKNGDLLLGLREQGPKFPVTDFCTRQVAVFGTDYKHTATFDRDYTGKRLFNYTRRITTDSEYNIYVVDLFDNEYKGKIVALNKNGGTIFCYNGCSSFNSLEAAFNPEDIVVTSMNTTIISDCNNHALHALNVNGQLIGLQITRNFDILYPHSLSMDDEGFLLIGSAIDKDAKIHVMKLVQ